MTVKALKKQLMAAIAMVVVSAIALSSSTYAWFAQNNDVTAKGMAVTATAEAGIAIAPYSTSTLPNDTAPVAAAFGVEAQACLQSLTNIVPTFTGDGANWYHTSSKMTNNGQVYIEAGYTDVSSDTTKNYYHKNKFQIKSMGGTQDVYVKEITVTRGTGQSAQDYDPSLRVLVKSGETTLIFAPLNSSVTSESISASTAASDAVASDIEVNFTTVNTSGAKILDDVTATPQDVEVYVYYSGEDPACKSDNIPSGDFNTLTVDVKFTTDISTTNP